MPRPTCPILSSRALNRATLARQLLLEPASGLDPVTALEQIGGVQAHRRLDAAERRAPRDRG